MNVVIIEDEQDLGLLICNFLKREAATIYKEELATITLATTLEEGLEQIAIIQPDWVLLDNNLPDGKGIDKISFIKSKLQDVRIVMMSAMSNLKDIALSNGADYFLDKPVSLKDIRSIITPLQQYP